MGGELGKMKDRVRQLSEALREESGRERVRIGVVGYRDKGDAYVTKRSLLETDVEVSFRFLAALTASGGGDGPEDVLSGLATAIRDINWDTSDEVQRQVFLIGDAPPDLDSAGHVKPEHVTHSLAPVSLTLSSSCRWSTLLSVSSPPASC